MLELTILKDYEILFLLKENHVTQLCQFNKSLDE